MVATSTQSSTRLWAYLGLALTALLSIAPLVLESRPVDFLPTPSDLGRVFVATALLSAVAVRAWLDQRSGESAWWTMAFALLAAAMTVVHWFMVDVHPLAANWQRDYYLNVLNLVADAPHNYRPLPNGFTRLLERLTGDWRFACIAYRWFFTFWFVWAAYRLARLVHDRRRALLTLLPLAALYPASIAYYLGQLTDPLSHALLVLGMIYVAEDRPWELAAALVLGVMAKETAVLHVPAYLACYWRCGWRAWTTTIGLGTACVAAYLAVRVPAGWLSAERNINGLNELMVETNLGIGEPIAIGAAPLYMNYLHPLLFVGVFLPFIAWRWTRLDVRLRTICLTVTPLLLLSNLCYGWMYESRNYLPLVPLLATLALPVVKPRGEMACGACPTAGPL
jgi:hypothetical protein